jgi:hypothetical protein
MLAAALSRRWWIVGLLTLALTAASGGLALGVDKNSIKVSTPFFPVGPGKEAVIKVSGGAIFPLPGDESTHIDVFTSVEPCKGTAHAEIELVPRLATGRLSHKAVKNEFKEDVRVTERARGKYYACAYLYILPQDRQVAHAADSWRVL